MRIIGIDPGYAITGYGLIEVRGQSLSLLEAGVVKTRPEVPFPQRLLQISERIAELLAIYKPEAMAVEELFLYKNVTTAIGSAQARGVVLVEAAKLGIPVFEYTPMQVKKAVTSYGKADKKQVQLMVQRLLGLKEVPSPDDMADALAVAICQHFTSQSSEQDFFLAQSGYQSQAQKKRTGARINLGKLADQIKD